MSEPTIPGGFILLSRKITDSEIWDKPPLYLKVWIYLLSKAQHSEYKKLKRGQVVTSIPDIMEDCSWYVGFRKEKPTKDQIFQVINWLRKVNEADDERNTKAPMITTMKATQHIIVNIVNYDIYQNPKNYESNGESNDEKVTKATREQRLPDNINKNDKNVKKDKNENIYKPIIEYLNQKANTKYKPTTNKTKDVITARVNEGFTLDDFIKVIDIKVPQWQNDKMAKFIRPETLFGNKFEGYLNESIITTPNNTTKPQKTSEQELAELLGINLEEGDNGQQPSN